MNTFISLLYSLLVGIAVVTFVGLGTFAFYPGPDHEESCYEVVRDDRTDFEQGLSTEPYYDSDEFRECKNERDKARQDHARNVTIIAMATTLVLTLGVLKLPLPISEIKDGLLLGAVMTAIYTIVWAGIAEHRVLLFFSGVLFLATAIVTGYAKFKAND